MNLAELNKWIEEFVLPLRGELQQRAAHVLTCPSNDHTVEDLVSEAFLRLIRALPMENNRVRPWLFTVVTNLAITVLRRRNIRRLVPIGVGIDEECPDILNQLCHDEARRLVQQAILKLSPEDQDLIELHYYQGFSCKDIVDWTGKSRDQVKKGLKRALNQLRTWLGPNTGSF